MRKFGPVEIGKGTVIGEDVLLGYPGKEHTELLISDDTGILPTTRIGSHALVRDRTVIYAGVILAEMVQTGHHVLIRENTGVGKRTVVGSGTIIEEGCVVGKDVSIQSGVYLSSGTIIEDNVFLGPMVCIINDRNMDSRIQPSVIKKGAKIGANSTILAGVTIGEGAVVGAGSVVTRDVAPRTKVYGVPAKAAPDKG